MKKKIVGIEPRFHTDISLIKDAGIEWVRQDFPFPFADKVGGAQTDEYLKKLEEARNYAANGIKIMGTTPLVGWISYDSEQGRSAWKWNMPTWACDHEQESFYRVYEDACEAMAAETAEIIGLWQIDNEMDIDVFRGPMSAEQAARLMAAGARGIKRGNPAAQNSINPALMSADTEYFFRTLYAPGVDLFDYAGIDGYFGSWIPGGPENWPPVIDRIYELTGKPVIVHEWGYSALDRAIEPLKEGETAVVCRHGWPNRWGNGHDEQTQADYIVATLKIFAEHQHCAGQFFFMWGDPESCFHCGGNACPAECGWGFQKTDGTLRKSYAAFRDAVRRYYL